MAITIRNINGSCYRRALIVRPIINAIIAHDITNFGKIADELNKQGWRTFKGHLWNYDSVRKYVEFSNSTVEYRPINAWRGGRGKRAAAG